MDRSRFSLTTWSGSLPLKCMTRTAKRVDTHQLSETISRSVHACNGRCLLPRVLQLRIARRRQWPHMLIAVKASQPDSAA
jgi:hypothetical protein